MGRKKIVQWIKIGEGSILKGEITVPQTVEDRKWVEFVKTPRIANGNMVHELFASMVPNNFQAGGAMRVRGVEVTITFDTINSHFKTDTFPDHRKGYKAFEETRSKLARRLKENNKKLWDENHQLKQSELPQLLAFLNMFHTCPPKPIVRRSTLLVNRAELLLYYISSSDIDIGSIIKVEIVTANYLGDKNLRSWKDVIIRTNGGEETKDREKVTEGLESDSEDIDFGDDDAEFEDVDSNDNDEDLDEEENLRLSKFERIMAAVYASSAVHHKSGAKLRQELDDLREDTTEILKETGLKIYQRRPKQSMESSKTTKEEAATVELKRKQLKKKKPRERRRARIPWRILSSPRIL
ncbi:hypothetical protein LWI29_020809 [Acer saccharum]|uniref:Putative plant transposon protein domain-containing protein n=1 Tax=Acer saccharum TaxID=4024 RepID=A0AA39SEI0_ACESA|nr:hypothetical protein LWI29_020809 [Acer saccharum]